MADQSIFDDKGGETQQPAADQQPAKTDTTPAKFALPDEVVEYVGEGKKYSDEVEALKSIPHAQTHIQKLEEELAVAREQLTKAATFDELLQKIETKGTPAGQPPAQELDPSKVTEIVKQHLDSARQAEVQEANRVAVTSAMSEKFQDVAEKVYIDKAAELGISVGQLNEMSKTSPKVVLELFGLSAKGASAPSKTASSISTEGFSKPVETAPKKTIMVGASTKDLVDFWKASAPQT